MKYYIVILLGLLCSLGGYAQSDNLNLFGGNSEKEDTEKSKKQEEVKSPITDYKIISVKGDTTVVDTSLTIQKDYKFNYLRKDEFGLLMFSNIGHAYTELTKDFSHIQTKPEFGARAAHSAYLEVDDIYYYNVPTPWSNLFFKTTFEQGQMLDAFITSNISPQVNMSIAYKGLHSLGKYRHSLSSQGSFRTTLSYKTKNERYQIHTHFVSQLLKAEQNGGLTDLANRQFKSQSNEFSDRAVLDVKYEDAERLLRAKRFFFMQHFNLIQGEGEKANNELRIAHQFNFTDKEYYFDQGSPFHLYGLSYQNSELKDLTEFQDLSNQFSARFQNNILGQIGFSVEHSNYNYGYKRKLNLEEGEVPNRLKGDILSLGATYKKNIGGFELAGEGKVNTLGSFDGNYLRAHAAYQLDSLNRVEAGILTNTRRPNYNFLLYQSDYKNYNWSNDFKNVQKQRLHFKLTADKIANIQADYTRIHNYTYFGLQENQDPTSLTDSLVKPFQYGKDINYARVKINREFDLWRFSLDNTMMYQKVIEGDEVMHLPDFVTRHSFYYKDYWFKRNLYLQTGFTLNYFTGFRADAYDPVMGEFYVQDFEKIKGFSRLDFFFNARVRQARIFFKVENLTTLLDGNGHYAAPYEPYHDWNIRFGLVWDFFM